MKNAALDPAILFISEMDWQDEAKQDCFLNHLLDNLETIDRYSAARIVWNDEQEMCLWGYPQVPPWRKDRNWRNTMVPTLYSLLQKNRAWIENDCAPCPCGVAPPMNCCNTSAQACFLRLIHTMILRRQDVVVCLGLQNVPPSNGEYTFSCTCCPQALVPELIRQPNEWLQHVDLEDDHWRARIGDAEGLGKALV